MHRGRWCSAVHSARWCSARWRWSPLRLCLEAGRDRALELRIRCEPLDPHRLDRSEHRRELGGEPGGDRRTQHLRIARSPGSVREQQRKQLLQLRRRLTKRRRELQHRKHVVGCLRPLVLVRLQQRHPNRLDLRRNLAAPAWRDFSGHLRRDNLVVRKTIVNDSSVEQLGEDETQRVQIGGLTGPPHPMLGRHVTQGAANIVA